MRIRKPALIVRLGSGDKHATTAARVISFDIGCQFGESSPKPENILDHHDDGIWRCHDSPAISNGGAI